MHRPEHLHLRGKGFWERCSREQTHVLEDGSVRLATGERDARAKQSVDLAAWLAARRGALALHCRPDTCVRRHLMGLQRDLWLVDEGGGWRRLPTRSPEIPPGPLDFTPPSTTPPVDVVRALSRDPWGRIWALTGRAPSFADALWILEPEQLRPLAQVPLPEPQLLHAAVSDEAVYVAGAKIWRQPFGGTWTVVEPRRADDGSLQGFVPITVAGGAGDRLAAIYCKFADEAPNEYLIGAVGTDGQLRLHPPGWTRNDPKSYSDLQNPCTLLITGDDHVLIGDVEGSPSASVEFMRFSVTAEGYLERQGLMTLHAFDGRALWLDHEGRPVGSAAERPLPLRRIREGYVARGSLTTPVLDSRRYRCQWHRIFFDLCLPPGTRFRVEARTSDEDTFHDEQWIELPPARRRPALVDRALPPREHGPIDFDTFECVVNAPPGRYLWLRIHVQGTRTQSPVLVAIRATYPRPSILDHLPAFWREDPEAAARMERFLALFEGVLTELDARIDALPALFDPAATPSEALSWLASFIGLTFDQRLPEHTRRRLLAEMAGLYRQRGTIPGLRRLVQILTDDATVHIVEAFRLRRRSGAILGAAPGDIALGGHGSVLGPGLQLGERLVGDGVADDVVAFYGATAHRFQVLVGGTPGAELRAVVDEAIEANKPAHTLHELCWLDTGFRLDVSAYVGLSWIGDADRFKPAILGAAHLGIHNTLSHAPIEFGTALGSAAIGRTTRLA